MATGKERQREYNRQYRAANRDHIRVLARAWSEANREKERERKRKLAARRRAANPQKAKEDAKRWRLNNPEKERAKNAARYAAHPEQCRHPAGYYRDWRAKNPDKARAIVKRYADANPEAKRCRVRKRRARLRQVPGSHTKADIEKLFDLQKGRCAHSWCRKSLKSGYHVDHKEPIILGGSNDPTNLQLLCPRCNRSKGAKRPEVFAQQNGMLL
jgi:5-methylcytosine-specific restriction endonuclease McrA